MSHSYAFRHGKSHSTASSTPSSSSHQRVSYGSRSTSTGTPPQTPTIRVTSPVPDAVAVVDIWDPEVTDEEPRASSPKSYSFRYNEEKSSSSSSDRKKTYTDSGMQADSGQQDAPPLPVVGKTTANIPSPNDDDGLKTAGESEESSDCDEISQISAVTQVLRCPLTPSADETEEEPTEGDEFSPSDPPVIQVEQSAAPIDGKPVKRVQFSRSLSLVPGSNAATSVGHDSLNDSERRVRSGAGRRYSSLDSACSSSNLPLDIFPTGFTFADPLPASGGKMLSPTPESALENAQSPQQEEEDDDGEEKECCEATDEQQQQQQVATINPTTLSVTVEEVGEEHDPTCDLFDRLNALKNDEELMDLATGFVLQLLRTAQEEALRRGHVPSKMEQKSKMSLELQHVAVPKGRNNRKWYSRLRMLLLRTLTCTCVPTHPNIQSPLSN